MSIIFCLNLIISSNKFECGQKRSNKHKRRMDNKMNKNVICHKTKIPRERKRERKKYNIKYAPVRAMTCHVSRHKPKTPADSSKSIDELRAAFCRWQIPQMTLLYVVLALWLQYAHTRVLFFHPLTCWSHQIASRSPLQY